MAVAGVFHVEGPFKVEFKSGASASSWVELGQSDNDDLINYTEQNFIRRMSSTSSGREVEDAVFQGKEAVLSFALVKWIEANKATLQLGPGGSTQGDVGTVGAKFSDDGASGAHFFSIRIIPVDAAGNDDISASRPKYTFNKCLFDDGQGFGIRELGNRETVIFADITVVRDSNGNLYEYATS